ALTLTTAAIRDAGVTSFELGNLIATNGRSLLAVRQQKPLFMRNLTVASEATDRPGSRDDSFKGVLAVSADAPPGEGFEKIPADSALMVSRDIRIEVAPMVD